jgi:hypothetical protein
MTSYNCGESGLFVGICDKPKVCFICAIPGHYMIVCPRWKETQLTAAYFGSVGVGLGFFHIDLPRVEITSCLNINNCGVVVFKKGKISLSQLEQELSIFFCNKWPWHIRKNCLIFFATSLPSFNMRKGVQVEVKEWIGDLDHFSELSEVWTQLDVIPPKWCDVTSSHFGPSSRYSWQLPRIID